MSDTPRTDALYTRCSKMSSPDEVVRLLMDEHAKLERELAALNDDRLRAFKIGWQWTNECQTVEEMTASLAALIERMGKARSPEASSIDKMVDRFLGWRLPEDFHPDGGISFNPEYNVEWNAKHGKPPERHQPIGTNLLTATQARAMLEHVLGLKP